jgi:hypothetical protein
MNRRTLLKWLAVLPFTPCRLLAAALKPAQAPAPSVRLILLTKHAGCETNLLDVFKALIASPCRKGHACTYCLNPHLVAGLVERNPKRPILFSSDSDTFHTLWVLAEPDEIEQRPPGDFERLWEMANAVLGVNDVEMGGLKYWFAEVVKNRQGPVGEPLGFSWPQARPC